MVQSPQACLPAPFEAQTKTNTSGRRPYCSRRQWTLWSVGEQLPNLTRRCTRRRAVIAVGSDQDRPPRRSYQDLPSIISLPRSPLRRFLPGPLSVVDFSYYIFLLHLPINSAFINPAFINPAPEPVPCWLPRTMPRSSRCQPTAQVFCGLSALAPWRRTF